MFILLWDTSEKQTDKYNIKENKTNLTAKASGKNM